MEVIVTYLIFVTTNFRVNVQFFILLENQWAKSMKNVEQWEFTPTKISDNNLKFS